MVNESRFKTDSRGLTTLRFPLPHQPFLCHQLSAVSLKPSPPLNLSLNLSSIRLPLQRDAVSSRGIGLLLPRPED